MIRKIVCLFAIAALTFASCKNDATAKIDPNSPAIPPASPDAVIAPEANIGGPAATATEAPTPPPADGKYPVMTFGKSEHDFGKINEGDNVTYNFAFKNSGQADLLISNATGSCGCTVPEFPKEPIKPGESGKIKVSFNSAGKPGQQKKTVTITANTANGTEKLNIIANVTPKDGSNMQPVN